MSKKWKIILGLVAVLCIGGYVMTNITQDEAQVIEREVKRVHGQLTTVMILHVEKIDRDRILVFYESGLGGQRFAVAELKKTLLSWKYENGFSLNTGDKKRRYSVSNEFAVMTGPAFHYDDFHEIKIETANGDVHTATIIESERGTKIYWFYVVEEESKFEEMNDVVVYTVTEDGEVIEEIEKPDNDPLY
ncbi:BH4021 [Halalkalibacterium halodurans C-125]|uniref:BH4021 protein n=2 Tax=Halalkalibacterium halodurans TaxID=86665 RepID=Q9K5R7_HALH5|nr:PQQ-binding-like beta-propeller repeat protein [Halalkalibacterium halodurans]BAB07740.1 BH4021 [Halalkalibacterium halodurans C-125]